jgi:hypothetical protein
MKMLKKIFVFELDFVNGVPVLSVATKLDDIPDYIEEIGEYKLIRESKLIVYRELRPCNKSQKKGIEK